MVKVTTYEPSVELRPAFRQNLDANATPQAFGSDVGAGMGNLAKGMMSAAESIAAVRALEDETVVRQRRNEFMAAKDALQYDPDKGYLTSSGKAALDDFDQYKRDLAQLRRDHSQGLTPAQQNIFDKAVTPLEIDAQRSGMVHKYKALKAYVVEQGTASAESFKNQALTNYRDQALWRKYTAAGQLEVQELGRKLGWSSEKLGLEQQNYVSDVVRQTTLRIAQSDPVAADKFRKENIQLLTGADRFSLESALSSEIKIEQSKRNADEFLQKGRVTAPPAARTAGQAGPTAARATLYAALPGGKGREHVDGLDEAFATNLGAMIQDAPPEIRKGLQIGSGFRSVERQRELWEASDKSGKMVAPPGRSFHNHGQAVDLWYNGQRLDKAPAEVRQWVHSNASAYGLFFPMGYEPWHIEPQGTRGGGNGTVAPRTNTVAPRAAMASYDDLEGFLSGIKDTKVRDLTRQRIMTGIEMQNKAAEAKQKQAAATLWSYVDQGQTPDQVPLEVRQAAGMSAVSSAWGYLSTVKNGRDPTDDETLVYDMRRYAARDPNEFAKVDLNDYRGKLSRATLKELTGLQTTALTDQKKAREDGLNLTAAFSQAEAQLAAVGISTVGKKGSQLEAVNRRVAQFNNALSSEMDEFKRTNNNRAPNQMEIQSMINRLLLPVVVKTPGWWWRQTDDVFKYWTGSGIAGPGGRPMWGTNEWKPKITVPTGGFFSSEQEYEPAQTFAFETANRPDRSFVDVVMKYEDIPIDLRRTIIRDIENETGRQPGKDEVMSRYQKFVTRNEEFVQRR